MRLTYAFALAVALGCSLFAPGRADAAPRPAIAIDGVAGSGQEVILAQNFLDRLFGGITRPRIVPVPQQQQEQAVRPRARVKRPQQSSTKRRSEPAVVAQPKDENAKRVFVFGDAFASGLENGLQEAFSETPTVEIVSAANPGSGLVRVDYHDWNEAIAETLETEKVDYAVVMLGSNDRQQMRLDQGRVSIRSETWQQTYIERVDAILAQFAAKNIPVFWVGLPIMRSSNYGADMAYLNEIYQARTQRFGAIYVDTWDGFADENGKYASSGPDVNGKNRRLRAENGIHLTKHGNLKLAFFVEKEIRAVLERGGALANIPLIDSAAPALGRESGPVEMDISLTSPAIPPLGIELLGAGNSENELWTSSGERDDDAGALAAGAPTPSRSGRADDFSWPRNSRTGQQGTPDTPAI